MEDRLSIGLYTKDNCVYCIKAKELLKIKGLKYKEQKIECSQEREQLKKKFPEARTYPIIVVNGEWIGGFDQLQELLREEE